MIKKVGLIIIVIATIFNLILPMQTVYAADPKKENVNEVMGGISEDSADSLINDGKTIATQKVVLQSTKFHHNQVWEELQQVHL